MAFFQNVGSQGSCPQHDFVSPTSGPAGKHQEQLIRFDEVKKLVSEISHTILTHKLTGQEVEELIQKIFES